MQVLCWPLSGMKSMNHDLLTVAVCFAVAATTTGEVMADDWLAPIYHQIPNKTMPGTLKTNNNLRTDDSLKTTSSRMCTE